MPARGAVGDDERVGVGLAHRRQQRELAHRQRDVDRVGAVAERAGHAAAARLHGLDRRDPGMSLRMRSTAPNMPNAFWWQWPCTSARFATGLSGRLSRPSAASRTRNSSNISACIDSCSAPSVLIIAGTSSRKPRMQLGSSPITGTPRATIGRDRRDHALGLAPRLVDLADRQEGAAAAERALRAVRGLRDVHRVAGGAQHRHGGVEVLALEVAVEGVGEQDDLAPLSSAPPRALPTLPGKRGSGVGRVVEHIAAPLRQRAARAEAGETLGQSLQHRIAGRAR